MVRRASFVLIASIGGFVLCFSFVGGCSLFGGDGDSSSSSSASSGNGGAAGAGGSGGTAGAGGGETTSSSSSGMPIECVNHTNLDETNCSLLKQDCKGDGEMCLPAGTVTQCVYETGVKGSGASCLDNKECAAGHLCISGICAPFCCPAQPEAYCGSAKCNLNVNVGGGFLFVCNLSQTCTLFGDDCPENQQCRLTDPEQELALCAQTTPTASPEGGPCMFINDCGANQMCFGGTCRYTCTLADWQSKGPGEGGCPTTPMMQTCQNALANSTTYGVCTP